jgi:hypothetical protein
MDISSFVDYYCTEIYFNNRDWPNNNHKIWRSGEESKWRWALFDFDAGWGEPPNFSNNTLEFASSPNSELPKNPPFSTYLFRKLLESEVFVNYFIERYACLMNNEFLVNTVEQALDRFVEIYSPLTQQFIDRWNYLNFFYGWEDKVNTMLYDFNANRRKSAIQHVSAKFNIEFNPDDYYCTDLYTEDSEIAEHDNRLIIYPNPSNGQFSIVLDGVVKDKHISVEVVTLLGQSIHTQQFNNTNSAMKLDLNYLAKGRYFIRVSDGGYSLIKPLVII